MGCLLIFGVITVYAVVAFAHCFPDRSTPAAASVLDAAPSQVAMHFDHPFDPASTSIRVLNEKGDVVSGPGAASSDDRTMSVPLKPLSPGQYFVKWRALSKDGDHTMGAYSFTVKGRGP